MNKIILPLLTLIFFVMCVPIVQAASLDVSKSSNFSSEDLNFGGGDTVYIRVESGGTGSSQRILNIRDSQYNLLSSVDLTKSGNTFSASFSAPGNQGYFSLEAVIEGDGESSKSVKTIKVGSPSSANVKVNVNSSVKGTKSERDKELESVQREKTKNSNDKDNNVSPTPEVFSSDNNLAGIGKSQEHFWLFTFFKNIFFFFWPFK